MTSVFQSPHYPLQPASLDLALHVGRTLAWAKGDRLALYQRIYSHMTPQAKARADFACTWLVVEGGATND